MKILFLTGGLGSGGAARQFMELTKRIQAHGVIPVVCTLDKNQPEYENFFDKLDIKHIRFTRRGPLDFSLLVHLIRLIKDHKIDLIQTWQLVAGLYGTLAARLGQKRVICSTIRDAKPHSSFSERLSKKFQARFSDVFVSNTEYGLKTQFKQWRNNFKVITNGIDLNRFQDLDKTRVAAIQDKYECKNTFNIVMAANLRRDKDPFTLVKAAVLLKSYCNDFKVFIIGEGETQEELKKAIRESDLTDTVFLLGYRHDVEYYISAFDVSVLLANTNRFNEGISNFLLESIALKKVVVATKGGGNLEVVKDNETGYLIDPFDAEQLCEKLLLIKNSSQDTIVEKAYADMKKRFDMTNYVRNYYETYRGMLS